MPVHGPFTEQTAGATHWTLQCAAPRQLRRHVLVPLQVKLQLEPSAHVSVAVVALSTVPVQRPAGLQLIEQVCVWLQPIRQSQPPTGQVRSHALRSVQVCWQQGLQATMHVGTHGPKSGAPPSLTVRSPLGARSAGIDGRSGPPFS